MQGGGCGDCEYADKSGKCQTVPSSADCDGIDGNQEGWNCGTCSYWTIDYFYGYCNSASGMTGC